jgi:hypothetical protein
MASSVSHRPLVPEDALYRHPDARLTVHKVRSAEPIAPCKFPTPQSPSVRRG